MRTTIVTLVCALVVAVAGPAGATSDPMAGDGSRAVVDFSFPVAGRVAYGDDWYASRGSRGLHRAQDLVGTRLERVHAAMSGTVCYLAADDHHIGGYEMAVCGDDGRRYVYSHLNDDTPGTDDDAGGTAWAYAPHIHEGARVARGQWLGWMGDSGNAEAEGPQLHFHVQTVLTDPDTVDGPLPRLDPAPSLHAAQDRGNVPAVVQRAPLERLGGATRLQTAVAISRRTYDRADTVLVAPASTPQAALLAAPLAGLLSAPVLLADPGGLTTAASDEVARLGATHAILIGDDGDLGDAVAEDLTAAGASTVERLRGTDPASLSVAVAGRVGDLLGHPPARVLLARGLGPVATAWPDALAAGTLAARAGVPVLLTGAEALPAVVADALDVWRPDRLDVVGGTAAVSDAVVERARGLAGATGDRLAGSTRYGTSVALADAGLDAGLHPGEVWLATGLDFPDALAAAPAAAQRGGVLLLVDGQRPGAAQGPSAWLADHAAHVNRVVVVGGERAVTPLVALHATELAARSSVARSSSASD